MAFYFALFNVSNVNFERRRASDRHARASSLPRRGHALHDYRLLPRPRLLASQEVRPPTPPLQHRSPSPLAVHAELPEPSASPLLLSCRSAKYSKKVTFDEGRQNRSRQCAQAENIAFLDDREAWARTRNGNTQAEDPCGTPAEPLRNPYGTDTDRCGTSLLGSTLSSDEPASSIDTLPRVQREGVPLRNVKAKQTAVNHRASMPGDLNEECCLVYSPCSGHRVRAAAVHNSLQNVHNETIEHKILLSLPPRRRRWKPSSLIRRRSTSDKGNRYGWSYINPGFRFAEEEQHRSLSSRMSVSLHENHSNRPAGTLSVPLLHLPHGFPHSAELFDSEQRTTSPPSSFRNGGTGVPLADITNFRNGGKCLHRHSDCETLLQRSTPLRFSSRMSLLI